MRQQENRTYGNSGLGKRKMLAAAKIARGERTHKARKDIEARNAYRRAIGLPEVTE